MNLLGNTRAIIVAAALGLIFAMTILSAAVDVTTPGDITVMTPDRMGWVETPPAFPAGAKMSLLESKPNQQGPYTLRLKLPANFKIPPHFSASTQHLTVISGTVYLGSGDKMDIEKGTALTAGSFVLIPAKTTISLWTTSEAIVQFHGLGPWEIHYVNTPK